MGRRAREDERGTPPAPGAIARLADGVLEAGWLMALGVVPAFFNVHSNHPFEHDKAMVVRLLAVLMAAAGLVRALEAWPHWRRPREVPLLAPLLFYAGAATLSTALSVAPRVSLWGSYLRGEGLMTLAAYLVVFAALASRLRRREQVDRALDVIVAGSLPVCLYGLMQAAGLEMMDWKATYFWWRVPTTLGNPVFAGSYLILALPVTLAALLERRARPAPTRGALWSRRMRLALYAAAALLQLATLALTGSRGPWLGGAAALLAFALLGAALGRRRKLAAATLALAVAGVTFVAVLNVPHGPLERLRRTPTLGRIGRVFDERGILNPGERGRLLIWDGAMKLAGGAGHRGALRPLIGYGPETFQLAFGAVYKAEFARISWQGVTLSDEGVTTFSTQVPDRSHNELLDSLVLGGLVGGIAHLWLFAAILTLGLRVLGLLAGSRDRLRLAGLALTGGAALGSVAAGLSWNLVGVGLPLGLVAGWMVYVLLCTFGGPRCHSPLLVGLLSALLGHFVDIHFGLVAATGRLYFWALAGLLVAASSLRYREKSAAEDAVMEQEPALHSPWRPLAAAVPAGLLAASLLVTLVYDFVVVAVKGGSPVAAALHIVTSGAPAHRAALAAGAISVLLLLLVEVGRCRGSRAWAFLGALIVAAFVGLAFAAVHTGVLRRTAEARTVADVASSVSAIFAGYTLCLLGLALTLGAALALRLPRAPQAAPIRASLQAVAVLAAAFWLAVPPAVASAGADEMMRLAAALRAGGRDLEALALLDHAARLAPWEAANFRSQGEAYLKASRRTESPVQRQDFLSRAESAFLQARKLDPLLPDHSANLARVARWRSELSRAPAIVQSEAEAADRHYAAAARLIPANTLLLDEWAEWDYAGRHDFGAAEAKLQRSLRLDPMFDYTYAAVGDFYMARARAMKGDPPEDYRRAAAAYAHAYALRASVKAAVSLGLAHEQLGQKGPAIEAYLRSLGLGPPATTSWAVNERLASLFLAVGNRPKAEWHAHQAMAQAPEEEKATLAARLRAARLVPGP